MGDEAMPGTPRNFVVFLSHRGVMAYDGANFYELSRDIRDKFDERNSNYISKALLQTATAFYDTLYGEYHLIIPATQEWVYDVERKKWWKANRGSYLARVGFNIYDANGSVYPTVTSGGKLYRTEYSTSFAGSSIPMSFRTADIALNDGSIMEWTQVNWFILISKSKTNTDQDITMTYYVDSATNFMSTGGGDIDSTRSGYRLINEVKHYKDLQATFHSFRFYIATDDEAYGFEPMYLGIRYTTFPRELS
jgi:hypothetical protein